MGAIAAARAGATNILGESTVGLPSDDRIYTATRANLRPVLRPERATVATGGVVRLSDGNVPVHDIVSWL